MKDKLIIFLSLFLILGSFIVSAEVNTYAPVKQNECITIKQTCASCSYVNLSVSYPNSSLAISNQAMNSEGAGVWTYEFCETIQLGRYDVNGEGDVEGSATGFSVLWFEVTPSGNSKDNSNVSFFIFVILLIYGITFTGFFGKNIPVTILGGMAMIFLGVYLVNNGIIIYRDNLTNYIAYLTLAIGAILASWAGLEQLEVI